MNPLIYLEISTSTNFDIQKFKNDDSKYLGLYTSNQTNGRGQYNNTWEMQPNLNLAFSYLFNAEDFRARQQLLNFHTATLVRDFIAKLTHQNVEIKWPNDIIIKGKKIGGLLIEKKKINQQEVFIVGFGLNVLQTYFNNHPKAGSLLTQTQQSFKIKEIAEELFDYFTSNILNTDNILEQFNNHLFRKEKISVFLHKNIRQNGIIKYADSDGYLFIDLEIDGLQRFFHKEIELLY